MGDMEILGVSRATGGHPGLFNWVIESPRPAVQRTDLDMMDLIVSGWVIPNGDRIDALMLRYENAPIYHRPLSGDVIVDRPDVAGAFPEHPGARRAGFRFRASVNMFGSVGPFDLDLCASIAGG